MRPGWLKLLLNLYPPYLGAGVRVTHVGPGFRRVDVRMALRPWNRNYVGTHFGGSLFSMVDPFHMLMLMQQLGRGYTVWDKAATIRFRRPGRGTVHARFEIPAERVEELRRAADAHGKVETTFAVKVVDGEGEVIAEVEKLVSIRKRADRREEARA